MKAKRILLLVTDLQIGGTPTVVRELAIRLHLAGVDVQVACLGEWGPTAKQIQDAGVTVTALDARTVWDIAVFTRLSRLLNEQRIDVVLSFLVHANIAATLARLRRRFVLHQSIQTTQIKPRWHWLAQGVASWFAQSVIVPSESVAQVARRRSFVPAAKLIVLPNAIDGSGVAQASAFAVPGRVRVGFIGRLDPIKRVVDLVDAMSHLPEEYELAIYGQGADEARIISRITQRQMTARVAMKGSIDGPWQALAEMDLLVLPSQAEGFGLVLIEAMAAGVPVVAANAPGIRDVVQDGENGLLVPVGNPQALAQAIERLAGDSDLREHLIKGGKLSVNERYSWGSVLDRYRRALHV